MIVRPFRPSRLAPRSTLPSTEAQASFRTDFARPVGRREMTLRSRCRHRDLDRRGRTRAREHRPRLGPKPTPGKYTQNEINALVRQLKDIVGALGDADPEDK